VDDSTWREHSEPIVIDEEELWRRFLYRVSDWSEPGSVKVYRKGKLLGPLFELDEIELRKRIFTLEWSQPR